MIGQREKQVANPTGWWGGGSMILDLKYQLTTIHQGHAGASGQADCERCDKLLRLLDGCGLVEGDGLGGFAGCGDDDTHGLGLGGGGGSVKEKPLREGLWWRLDYRVSDWLSASSLLVARGERDVLNDCVVIFAGPNV